MNSPVPRFVALRVLALTTVIGLLMGCATMRYGGAPEPSFDINTDIEQLSQHFGPETSITGYYSISNPTKGDRNKFIVGRLTFINLRYIKFIRNLTSERQLLDSATAITILGLGLAGSAVPYAETKTILAAIAAGVTGSKEVIDKNYYFQKTIPALVAQMNAERQKALTPILKGMQASVEDYRFEQAVVDLNNYYCAGTFTGAIQSIQADASVAEQKQKEVNAKLLPLTPELINLKQKLTVAIGALKQQSDLPKIQKAIKQIDPKVTPADTLDAAKAQLQGYVRRAHGDPTLIEQVAKAFEEGGISLPAK